MPRYVKTSLDAIGVGDIVRVTEHFPQGSTVTYEGAIKEIRREFWTDPATGEEYQGRTATLRGVPYEHPSFQRVKAVEHRTIEVVLPDLPTTPGALVRTGSLRLAVYLYDNEEGETVWRYVDRDEKGYTNWAPVPDDDLAVAQVVFDPAGEPR